MQREPNVERNEWKTAYIKKGLCNGRKAFSVQITGLKIFRLLQIPSKIIKILIH